MSRMSSKKLVIFIVCVVAGIAAATAVVFFVSRSESSDQAEITENSSGETSVCAWDVDDSAAHAKALYKCAVSDVGDTASVVDLLETMGLEKVSGEYKAEISSKDGKEVLALTLSEKISGKDKKVFDNNMKLCAQQMLALIPGVQAVEWTYSIESDRCRGGAGYGISGCGWCKGRTVSRYSFLRQICKGGAQTFA